MLRHTLLALWLWIAGVLSLNASEWAKQSIYQVLTDRFARTDGSTSASCTRSEYCGGTWRGLINNLDYIKEMGFTAVRLFLGFSSLVWCWLVSRVMELRVLTMGPYRFGSLPSWRK